MTARPGRVPPGGARRSGGRPGLPAAGRVLQALFLTYLVLVLGTAAAGLITHYRQPRLVGSPQFLDLLDALGIPLAAATTVSFVLPIVAAALLACAVFLGRRDDRMALLFAAGLLGLFVYFSGSPRALAVAYPRLSGVASVVETMAIVCVVVLLYVFPDGRFRPRWTLPLAAGLCGILVVVPGLPATGRLLVVDAAALTPWKVWLVAACAVALVGTALPAQVTRYRRHAGPVERQQQRWVLFGLATILVPAVLSLTGAALGAGRGVVWVLLAMSLLSCVLPAAAAVALFRYRLFDLDRVVSRTVSWAALTFLLAVVYAGLVVVLQATLAPLAGGSDLAVATSTLAVAALFSTARRRTQDVVDRSFYRSRYDARRVVERFGESLRDEVDLEELVIAVTDVVKETLQPATATVWLQQRPEAGRAHAPGKSPGRAALSEA